MSKNRMYRNEWKYIINNNIAIGLKSKLESFLSVDSFASDTGYYVNSLYYDDLLDSNLFDNDIGTSDRHKYRIRYYNYDQGIHLERKNKENEKSYKDSCILDLQTYQRIREFDIYDYLYDDNVTLRMFCLNMVNKGLRPVVIIQYNRLAYTDSFNNIRITIDSKICASSDVDNFLCMGFIGNPVLLDNKSILEVKFDSYLPAYIRGLITEYRLERTAFSKYVHGRRAVGKVL